MSKTNRIWVKFSVSVIIAVIITMTLISYMRYLDDKRQIAESIDEELTLTSQIASLAVSDPLWNYNLQGVKTLVDAMFEKRIVASIVVTDLNRGEVYARYEEGEPYQEGHIITKRVGVFTEELQIGWIEIGATDYYLFEDLKHLLRIRIYDTLMQVVILMILTSIIALSVTRPIKKLENAMVALTNGDYDATIDIDSKDEVGRLAEKFNFMANEIRISTLELHKFNDALENLVNERTNQLNRTNEMLETALAETEESQAELIEKNDVLLNTLDALEKTREELIQTAKTSLTSQLVAGVAHEINTPVGVSFTTSTYLNHEVDSLLEELNQGKLEKEDFKNALSSIKEAATIIQRNLEHSAVLIENFKEVAVDQSGLRMREFNLGSYVNEVLDNLRASYKRTNHHIEVECEDEIVINSYPGAYSQIITNLLMNSLQHGFKGIDEGHIKIAVLKENNQIKLVYSDDGRGIKDEVLPNIFTPFYSTSHGDGGSGLGLSVINNLVTTVLSGKIECQSKPDEGVVFTVSLPYLN